MFHKPIRAAFAAAMLATSALSLSALPALAQVVYNRGQEADPETLDPQKVSTSAEFHIMRDLFETLIIHDGQGKVVPGVAEKWEVADDGKLYRFTLRANARWSNGDAVKASDFVFAWRRAATPDTGAKYVNVLYPVVGLEAAHKGTAGASVEAIGIRAVDDRTLEVRLTNPTPYFIELLTLRSPRRCMRRACASMARTSSGRRTWCRTAPTGCATSRPARRPRSSKTRTSMTRPMSASTR